MELLFVGILFLIAALVAVIAVVWALKVRAALTTAQSEVAGLRQHLAASAEQFAAFHRQYGPIVTDAQRHQQLRAELTRLEAELAATANRKAEVEQQAQKTLLAAIERAAATERDASARAAQLQALAQQHIAERERQLAEGERQSQARIQELQRTIGALEEQAELQSMGFYQLRYDFDSSAQYEARLEQVRDRQKSAMKDGRAAVCDTKWTVDGNARAGEKMVKDQMKLMLRAFNGECDAAVMRVRYNNLHTLERRVQADFEAINKIGASKQCRLTAEFLDLKLAELHLVFEYQERKQKELEEQRAIREQMRDEERAQREMEQARREAEREEQRYEAALEKARREAEEASGRQRDSLERKIAELSAKLADATAKQKAISQAQLTTTGHVYVISNLGSFGEQVYKIGMTRRLDPMERVIELGDASVPFPFDVHAMIHTENAPELERVLHQRFHERRVNLINERKEFFRVTLDEIEGAVREIVTNLPRHVPRELVFTRTAAAEDYRKSVAMRSERAAGAQSAKPPPLPEIARRVDVN